MMLLNEGRWPSIYTLEDLKNAVRAIVDSGPDFDSRFYDLVSTTGDSSLCQGDIVRLSSPFPMLDQNGQAVADEDFEHWLVVSNSCDHERSGTFQLVPLPVVRRALEPSELQQLRRYEYSKRFYVPPWPGCPDAAHRIADFTRIATVDMGALRSGSAVVAARMQFAAWAVLHTVLVMYLARDDGRFD